MDILSTGTIGLVSLMRKTKSSCRCMNSTEQDYTLIFVLFLFVLLTYTNFALILMWNRRLWQRHICIVLSKHIFFHVVSGDWNEYDYNPVRERESNRAAEASEWYKTVTEKPVLLGKRLCYVLSQCGLASKYEYPIQTEFGSVRTDIFTGREKVDDKKLLIELKVFSSENTMPSSIKDAIKTTMRKYAQLAGFLNRQ